MFATTSGSRPRLDELEPIERPQLMRAPLGQPLTRNAATVRVERPRGPEVLFVISELVGVRVHAVHAQKVSQGEVIAHLLGLGTVQARPVRCQEPPRPPSHIP